MNFFDKLLTTAAGYFDSKQKADAEIKLKQIGLLGQQPAVVAPAPLPSAAPSATWIPGVSNTVVLASAAGLAALLLVVVVARKS